MIPKASVVEAVQAQSGPAMTPRPCGVPEQERNSIAPLPPDDTGSRSQKFNRDQVALLITAIVLAIAIVIASVVLRGGF